MTRSHTSHPIRRRLRRSLGRTGAFTAGTALVGSAATRRPAEDDWFTDLRKPSFQPPPVAFPLVWTALYADIAVTSATALARLREEDPRSAAAYQRALAANLAINASWSWVFFRAHRLWAAPVVAGVLTASSTDLVRRTARTRPAAGAALAPYAVWCAFATVLSGSIWWINRGRSTR
ncbi:TspO/MBR family protein [Prescottella equi]|uniref:TspO/MBR family protein n=1 Tax=Rhodococcus hoagii TaxID=43767 RepID=UPI001C76F32A|nr:TspO/MBR family protein [Prescottella equi]BCN76780.1 tryptophan-rich sensory protein [Prescottella equi]